MLDKLTPKQEALIPKIREKWIYLALHAGDEIDEKGAKKGILNLYKMAKLKTPVIVLLDSPLAIQYGANQINKGSQVRSQVRSQVGSQKLNVYLWGYQELSNDSGWVSFYDYFVEIKILKHEAFNAYMKYLQSGVFMTIFLDDYAFICRRPKAVRKNATGFMNSDQFPAIEWRDGFKLHYLNGVYFPEDLWKKVVSKEMPFEEILAIKDIDQRTQAMRYGDVQKFFEHTKSTLLDSSDKGNELWFVPQSAGIFRIDAYFLKYKDPSTDKIYMSGIDPEIGQKKDADLSMAWKHGNIPLEDYKNMKHLVHES